MDDVAILHHILLTLTAHQPLLLGPVDRATAHNIGIGRDLGADEAPLNVGVDGTRRLLAPSITNNQGGRGETSSRAKWPNLRGQCAARDGPRVCLFGANREERLLVEALVRKGRQLGHPKLDFIGSKVLEQCGCLLGRHGRQLRL